MRLWINRTKSVQMCDAAKDRNDIIAVPQTVAVGINAVQRTVNHLYGLILSQEAGKDNCIGNIDRAYSGSWRTQQFPFRLPSVPRADP